MNFRKEYHTYPSLELSKIANSTAGEYRPEAIEAARAELANRGETRQTAERNSGERPYSPPPERDWQGRRGRLMMQYALCWALVAFGAVSLALSLIALKRQGDFSSWSKGLQFPAILVLVSLVILRGLHKRLFQRTGRAKKAGPVLSLLDRLESLRPPPMEGETDPERKRSKNDHVER